MPLDIVGLEIACHFEGGPRCSFQLIHGHLVEQLPKNQTLGRAVENGDVCDNS